VSAFDTVLANMKSLGLVDEDFQGAPITPQIHPTSVPLEVLRAVPVTLLVEARLPTVHTRAGTVAKRQPAPLAIGDPAYVKLDVNGLVNVVPFERAGTGYELVKDAREGVHYAFDLPRTRR
jgi:hypothetical protein